MLAQHALGATVFGENAERWRTLCEQAANEQDAGKLLELVREINRLLEEKEQRLKASLRENKLKIQ